jgi:hypothetical protein
METVQRILQLPLDTSRLTTMAPSADTSFSAHVAGQFVFADGRIQQVYGNLMRLNSVFTRKLRSREIPMYGET